jgi:hypothetical protein
LSNEANLKYKFRLLKYSLSHFLLLKRHLSVTWASTPYLAKRWRAAHRAILEEKRASHLSKPVGWKEYCEEGFARTLDIMVVTLAPTEINRSRSSTKRVDLARSGAAAIYLPQKHMDMVTTVEI